MKYEIISKLKNYLAAGFIISYYWSFVGFTVYKWMLIVGVIFLIWFVIEEIINLRKNTIGKWYYLILSVLSNLLIAYLIVKGILNRSNIFDSLLLIIILGLFLVLLCIDILKIRKKVLH